MTTREHLLDTAELWNALAEQQRRMDAQAADVAQLRQRASEVEALKAELERQRLEKVSLASRLAEVEEGHGPVGKKVSRAGLLKAAVAGAAGLAAGTALGGPQDAVASSGTMLYGGDNNADRVTRLVAISPTGGSYSGDAILTCYPTTAVGTFDGVRGTAAGAGSGVVGLASNYANLGYSGNAGVTGMGGGTGVSAFGTVQGVLANSQGSGSGVVGSNDDLAGTGVIGSSAFGTGGAFFGGRVPLHLQPKPGFVPPSGKAYNAGDTWVGNGDGVAGKALTPWFCTVDGNLGTWVPLMHGNSTDGTNETLVSRVSTQQYTLSNSDGVTWVDMDGTNLSLTITPKQNSLAIITGNSDLWTSQAGYNQDIGITISGGSYPTTTAQPEAWKESGGFAGTFSPNAAFVQSVLPLTAGVAYTVKLQWKANKNASGATIWAGAGPIGGKFSPTRLTVLLIPTP